MRQKIAILALLLVQALCSVCVAETDNAVAASENAVVREISEPDPYGGWKDFIQKRREISRNTVSGIKRHAHDGDYAFIHGHFIKKLSDGIFVFTDGKDNMEVRFDPDKIPSDFTLNEDYMVWGQMRRPSMMLVYMQALLLSPRMTHRPDHEDFESQSRGEGKECLPDTQMRGGPDMMSHHARHDEADDSEAYHHEKSDSRLSKSAAVK